MTPERQPNGEPQPRSLEAASVPVTVVLGGERRLEAETYLSEGFMYRQLLASEISARPLGELARVWQPGRLKGIRVSPAHGLPFLAATQAFDLSPRSRKWLAASQTPDLAQRYVEPGWILVTCSGNVGDTVMAYAAHEGMVVSHDLLRVQPNDQPFTGYLYTFLRTRYGRGMMRSTRYGNIIKHLEPEHLQPLPVPRFGPEVEAELQQDISDVFKWRDEAFELERQAESKFGAVIGQPSTEERTVYDVDASSMFFQRRRLDAFAHNPSASEATALVSRHAPVEMSALVEKVFGVPRFKHIYSASDARGAIPYLDSEDLFKLNPEITKFIPAMAKRDASSYFVQRGWVLMACSGQLYGFNGSVVLADESYEKSVVSNHVIRIVPTGIRPGYLQLALNHPTLGRPLILRNAFGTSIPEIDPVDVSRVPVARLGAAVEGEIADAVERACEVRMKAKRKESGAVAKLEKRIDEALTLEGVQSGRLKVNLPF